MYYSDSLILYIYLYPIISLLYNRNLSEQVTTNLIKGVGKILPFEN